MPDKQLQSASVHAPANAQNAPANFNQFQQKKLAQQLAIGMPSSEPAGDADEGSLLPPNKSQKIKGSISANCVVVSVKHCSVLSRHLELKQRFSTGYRNAKNMNT